MLSYAILGLYTFHVIGVDIQRMSTPILYGSYIVHFVLLRPPSSFLALPRITCEDRHDNSLQYIVYETDVALHDPYIQSPLLRRA